MIRFDVAVDISRKYEIVLEEKVVSFQREELRTHMEL